MPPKLDGKKLTSREHRQYKHVYAKTGSRAKATQAVRRSRRGKR